MSKKTVNKDSFEYSYRRLNEILSKLEEGIDECSLEELLAYYEEGLKLIKICKNKLSEAEMKIEKINNSTK